jgi:CelD/BcsL family acetyltransferase involved in cellulose biosynthesis
MRVTLVPWREGSPDTLLRWNEIRLRNPALASPYFHPTFTAIVGQASGNAEIAIIEEDKGVAALFPFQRMPGNIGVPVGHFLSDYHGLICEPDYWCDPRALLRQCRLVAWDFDHLISSQRCFLPFHESVDPSPQIDLSCGLDAYMRQHAEIKTLRMKSRRLERDHGPLRFVFDSSSQKAMQQLILWKSEQYRKAKLRNCLVGSWMSNVVRTISCTNDTDFAGLLSLLYAGDRLVAAQFGMRSVNTYHYWFPAYDPQCAYYSPGSILLLKMIENISSVGITMIDLGKGISEQKRRFMNACTPVATGAIDLKYSRYASRSLRRSVRSLTMSLHLYQPVRALLRAMR